MPILPVRRRAQAHACALGLLVLLIRVLSNILPNMPLPLAYLLTWTTRGTWLHGDRRGSVDHSSEHQHGRPLIPHQPARVEFERASMRSDPVVLDSAQRHVVERTVRDHLAFRGWRLLALNVRTNHVHLVASGTVPPERIMDQCKSWCTRRLREAGLVEPDIKLWTRHGSTRYLFTDDAVYRATHYVLNEQGPEPSN